MLLEGEQLGRYQLQHLLGSGGMGEVYLATDASINRQVAIKVIRAGASSYPDANATKEAARLFQRELRAIAMLDHPHILPLFDYGEEHAGSMTFTYMVMPYRKEGSLADWLQKQVNPALLSPQDVSYLLDQAASALQHAHDEQILHQDVKPSNFLIRSKKEQPNRPDLLLADFGVAKFISTTSSMSDAVRGTPAYMAPEQWEGDPIPATDQYALAIMAYELLTGRPPFQGGMGQMVYQHLHVQPRPPSTLNPRLPQALDTVLLQALSKKPTERFTSITAFAQAFRQAVQHVDMPAIVKAAPTQSSDLHATLAISKQEAQTGARRTLTLPGGRQVTVAVPAGAVDGQVIHLERQSELSDSATTGALILTLAITPEETALPRSYANSDLTMMSNHPIPDTIDAKNHTPVLPPTTPKPDEAPPRSRSSRQVIDRLQHISKFKAALLIGIALLIIGGSIGGGFFYFRSFNYFQRMSLLNTSAPNPYLPEPGTLALNDPLKDNSNGYFWGEGTDAVGNCQFTGGAFHISTSQSRTHSCTAVATNFSNFAYEVRMTTIQGDGGGIIFRSNDTLSNFYFFGIDQSGSCLLARYANNVLEQTLASTSTPSPAINQGLNQSNLIAVVANGSTIDLYVNNQHIGSVTDGTYSQGAIGVVAYSAGNPTEVVFSDARVWTL